MSAARPKIVTARVEGDELVIAGGGVDLIRMPVRSGLWLVARIAEAIVEARR